MNLIRVSIVYALKEKQWIKELELPRGSSAEDLIIASQFLQEVPDLQDKTVEDLELGVYAQKVRLDTLLNEGDRLEIYRPLQADPKEVRRQLALLGKTMGKR